MYGAVCGIFPNTRGIIMSFGIKGGGGTCLGFEGLYVHLQGYNHVIGDNLGVPVWDWGGSVICPLSRGIIMSLGIHRG